MSHRNNSCTNSSMAFVVNIQISEPALRLLIVLILILVLGSGVGTVVGENLLSSPNFQSFKKLN